MQVLYADQVAISPAWLAETQAFLTSALSIGLGPRSASALGEAGFHARDKDVAHRVETRRHTLSPPTATIKPVALQVAAFDAAVAHRQKWGAPIERPTAGGALRTIDLTGANGVSIEINGPGAA